MNLFNNRSAQIRVHADAKTFGKNALCYLPEDLDVSCAFRLIYDDCIVSVDVVPEADSVFVLLEILDRSTLSSAIALVQASKGIEFRPRIGEMFGPQLVFGEGGINRTLCIMNTLCDILLLMRCVNIAYYLTECEGAYHLDFRFAGLIPEESECFYMCSSLDGFIGRDASCYWFIPSSSSHGHSSIIVMESRCVL
jgi:hypothetical protein